MKVFDFTVARPMHGDRAFAKGDVRQLAVTDAAPLLRSGALQPKGKEATAAAEELLGPRASWGVRPVSGPAPTDPAMDANNARAAAEGASPRPAKTSQTPANGKDAGNAERNKADVTAPPAGGIHAGEPGVTQVEPDATAGAPAPADGAPAPADGAPAPVSSPARATPARSTPARTGGSKASGRSSGGRRR